MNVPFTISRPARSGARLVTWLWGAYHAGLSSSLSDDVRKRTRSVPPRSALQSRSRRWRRVTSSSVGHAAAAGQTARVGGGHPAVGQDGGHARSPAARRGAGSAGPPGPGRRRSTMTPAPSAGRPDRGLHDAVEEALRLDRGPASREQPDVAEEERRERERQRGEERVEGPSPDPDRDPGRQRRHAERQEHRPPRKVAGEPEREVAPRQREHPAAPDGERQAPEGRQERG